MKEIVSWKKNNRYNDERLYTLDFKKKTLAITGKFHYMRFINSPEEPKELIAADFEGGPYISIGREFSFTYKDKPHTVTVTEINAEKLSDGILCKVEIKEN